MKNSSRREFLKTSLLGSAAVVGSVNTLNAVDMASGPILDESQKYSASHFGAFKAHTKGGQFTGVSDFVDDKFATPMIQALPSRTYSPTRVKYPYVREGYLKNGHKSDTSKRGSEKFIRVSWDEALDLVAKEVMRVQNTYGYKSIYAGSYGWFCVGKLNNPQRLMNRMMKIAGGYVGRTGDYSTGAAQVIMPHVLGTNEVYEQQTSWDMVLKHAKNVVFWGADPMTTNQIAWEIPAHEAYGYMNELKKLSDAKKINVMSVDPVANDTQRYFEGEHIRIRPNTDVAMMLGMAHHLYATKMYDQEFIKKYTVGFKQFEQYLTGATDNTPKTPEWAERICGVSANTIRKFAEKLMKERSILMAGWATQRADHGEQFHWMMVTLCAMIGQIGLPGGGFGFSYHYAGGGTPTADAPGLTGISTNIVSDKEGPWTKYKPFNVPAAKAFDMIANPGKKIQFNGKEIIYPDIKMIYWAGGNPMHHHQDRNAMLKAWKKLETVIVHEPHWTSTARMADIILPTTTEIERNDIERIGDYSSTHFLALQKAVEPVGESKDDFEICREICKRWGYEKEFAENKTPMQWLEQFYSDALAQGVEKNISIPKFNEFWKMGYVKFETPQSAKEYVRHADFRENPMLNPLGTPSGKIEIFSKVVDGFKYEDCKGHPMWFEPAEWLGSRKAKKSSLHLLSPHPKYRLHSQLSNTWIRDLYEVNGREPIWIHPEDAKKRGIKNGDFVRVFNERGSTLAGAIVTNATSEGVLRMCEGGWYDPMEPGKIGTMCKHGDVNQLTIDKGTSSLAQANIANTALAEIEKYTGTIPEITVFEEPKTARK